MRRNVLVDLVAGFLLPLVPSLLLYGLFRSLNSAELVQKNQGIRLGGPVALYVILLYVAFRQLNKWRAAADAAETLNAVDPLDKMRTDLVGEWNIESISVNNHKGTSTSRFHLGPDKELVLVGGSFFENELETGIWTPDNIILDHHRDKVVFLYDLKNTAKASAARARGLMELTLTRQASTTTMHGTWEVIGVDHHSGTVTFTKK